MYVLWNFILKNNLFQIELTTVEIDPAMKYIAKKWFFVKENDKQKIIIQDGIKFIFENTESMFCMAFKYLKLLYLYSVLTMNPIVS